MAGRFFYLWCMKDNFSDASVQYAQYRPTYPQELFSHILQYVPGKNQAWDCATGNGQTARELSKHFEYVQATDISRQQLEQAAKADNIIYSVASAERSHLKDNSIDLITVSQALHWFNFDHFFKEVRRVATKDALLAVWTYNLLEIDNTIDRLIHNFHYNTIGSYWDLERTFVDYGYLSVPFPFKEIACPEFQIKVDWTMENLQGYLETWSAVKKYKANTGENPVPLLMKQIKKFWGNEERRSIIFPLYLRLGVIE